MKFYAADTETAGAATADEAASAVEPGDFASEILGRMGLKPDGGALPAETKTETKVETTPTPETKVETTARKEVIPDKIFEKKEEPAKADVDTELAKIGDPEFRSEKNRANWDAVKSLAEKRGKSISELDAKIKDLTGLVDAAKEGSKREADLQARLEAAQKTMDEYKGLVQKVNIDLDPEFRRQYVDGRQNLIKEARQIAEDSGVDPSTVETALNLKGKARTDALRAAASEFSPFDTSRMASVIQSLDRLDSEAQDKRGNPQEYFKQQEQAFKEQQDAALKKNIEETTRAYRVAETRLTQDLIALRKLDGEEHADWNKKGEETLSKSRAFWETNRDPERAAEMIIKGFATEQYEKAYVTIREERDGWKSKAEKFEKELEGLYSTGPKLGGQSTATKDGKPKDWADMVEDKMLGRT